MTLTQRLVIYRSRILAGACALTGALFVALELTGTVEPVEMPVAPHAVTVVLAVAAIFVVVAARGRPSRLRLWAVAAFGAGMLSGSLLAIPHTMLMLIIWTVSRVTGGDGSFELQLQWLSTAAHLTNTLAALLLLTWVVVEWRLGRDRCPACGRKDAAPPSVRGRRTLPVLAAVAIAGALPYGLLKTAWSLGWRGGLTGHAFDDVSFTSPGFGDTAVLTTLSIVVSITMGAAAGRGWVRRATALVGAIGSLMLVPVAAVGAVYMVIIALGPRSIDDTEIAPAAFLVVYGSFLIWGLALTALTVTYWRATRTSCRIHDALQGATPGGRTARGAEVGAR